MFPKEGKVLPNRDGRGQAEIHYATAIAAALREDLGGTHQATKTVMRWTGASERTVKNWFAARSTLTTSLGKIQTALLGKITPASTGPHAPRWQASSGSCQEADRRT